MTTTRISRRSTLLEAVRHSLGQASRYNPGDMVAPAAVLWTDADGQWQPLVTQLRRIMPELLTLGEYNPREKTGPAIWLRCVIERTLPSVDLPQEATPVIYIPRVGRQNLRAGEECPDALKPLVELQFRGTLWTQRNGRDWTVQAFLVSSDGGLDLQVARDSQTRRAMLGALSQLCVTPLSRLRGKHLEAEDFDKLMIDDTPRNLLVWMSEPAVIRGKWEESTWTAFCSRCKAEYKFDPETDGEIVASERLGMRQDAWSGVWQRFAESPALYPGIPDLLRRAKPADLIFDKESWPDENEKAKVALREELVKMEGSAPSDARKRIHELEDEHGGRRDWVWAQLGQAPLAQALGHLSTLVVKTASNLGGDTIERMARAYQEEGFKADDAALKAMASARSAEDAGAVKIALRTTYLPWLNDAARHFQMLVASNPLPTATASERPPVVAGKGQCLLFADGFRYDLAQRLVTMAEEGNLRVTQDWRWAGLPTVTATAKPVVSPVADKLSGREPGGDFLPLVSEESRPLTADRFRKLIASAGYQVLGDIETGNPGAEGARAWCEHGQFDKLGHTLQSKLAARTDEQLELLLERIQSLLDAGWKQVRVVTDHGWLLMPGGLPCQKLPKYLTECRWARCATLKESSHVEAPVAPWHWNEQERFAYGHGVSCFSRGNEYAHGGLSLQECLIPELLFESESGAAIVSVAVSDIQWFGMRCRVMIEPAATGLSVDIRTKPNDESSSIAQSRAFDEEGRAALLVPDESLEGTTVSVVVLDHSGRVLAKRPTTVGGEEPS